MGKSDKGSIIALLVNSVQNRIRNYPLFWDILTTTLWNTIAKVVGFLIPFFIATWFGVSAETDAFFFAYGLILFLSGIFAPVIESVIVPYIAETREKNEDVGAFVGRVLGVSGVGILVLTTVALLLIKPILSLITRFDSQSINLIYWLLIETAPLVILLVWTSVLAGTLNAYKRFVFPAISPAFRAIVNLGIIFIFKDTLGVHAIAWGYVIGEAVRLVILAGIIKRLNFFKLCLSLQLAPMLWEFLKTAFYQTIGMVAVGLNPIIDKTMASWLSEGSVSVLHYADRLYMIPVSFMVAGLFPVVLSHWSKDYYQKEEGQLLQKVRNAAKVALGVSLIVFLILVIFSRHIVYLAFARGELDLKYLHILQVVFICYLLGLIPYVAGSMFTRGHLVLKNTSILMKLAILNFFLNVVLNYVLMHFIGVAGIALSTSITVFTITILLFVSFPQRLRANAKINSHILLD